MIVVNWGVRKARIWLDELPEWRYDYVEVIEGYRKIDTFDNSSRRCIAIELLIPIGGRAYYGGIAVIFTPEQQEQLIVKIPISSNGGAVFEGSLARKIDIPYLGLPHEYATALLEGLIHNKHLSLLGGGTFQLVGAVHGRAGSSNWMFKTLGSIVLKLFSVDLMMSSEAELIQILQSELRWS